MSVGAGPEVFEQSAGVLVGAFEISGFGAMGHDIPRGRDQLGIELQRLAMRGQRLLSRRLCACEPGAVGIVTKAQRLPCGRELRLQRHDPLQHLDGSLGGFRLLRKRETA